MSKQVVSTDHAPAALGPYSQAIIRKNCTNLVFCSGQVPIDPEVGGIKAEGITEQTHQVFKNIQAVLAAAGSSLDKVVKATVFLKDMNHFQEMNQVYGEYFKGDFPARSAIQVARLPLDALVEIEVIAYVGE